jgi:hypothetical protein
MLEGETIHDPLLLYFIAIKRQPFLISGFLDTGEFVLLKDFAAHMAVHDSISALDPDGDKERGLLMLQQLVDSEAEDVIEGQKNAIMLHNATSEEVQQVAAALPVGWMATSVAPAIDLAKKTRLPVYDLKSVKWLDVDETTYDLAWARGLLQAAAGMDLRLKLKAFYHDAQALAVLLINKEADARIIDHLNHYGSASALAAASDMLKAFFGIDLAEYTDLFKQLGEAVETPLVATDESKPLITPEAEPEQERQAPLGPFQAEFQFLSRNAAFKRSIVKAMDSIVPPEMKGSNPQETYAWLRTDGPWAGGIPAMHLQVLFRRSIRGVATREDADALAAAFSASAKSFKLAPPDDIDTVVNAVIDAATFAPVKIPPPPLIKGRAGLRLPPVPDDIDGVLAWIGTSMATLTKHVEKLEGKFLHQGKIDRLPNHYTPPPPIDLEHAGGNELWAWWKGAMEGMQAWLGRAESQATPVARKKKSGGVRV